MAHSAKESREYNLPMDYFVGKLRVIDGAGLRVELKSENPTETGVWFRIHHGMTGASYGERITVTLTARSPYQTGVDIESVCVMPTQLWDAGKNKSNINVLFGYLEKDMASYVPQTAGAYVPPTPSQTQQVPPQTFQTPQTQQVPPQTVQTPQMQQTPPQTVQTPPTASYAPPVQTPPPAREQAPVSPASPQASPAPKFCVRCGNRLTPGANFCVSCGTRIGN